MSPTTSTKPTTSASPDVAAYQCDTDRGEDDLTSLLSKSQSTSLNSELTYKHGKADNLLAFYVSMSVSMLVAVTLKSSEEGIPPSSQLSDSLPHSRQCLKSAWTELN